MGMVRKNKALLEQPVEHNLLRTKPRTPAFTSLRIVMGGNDIDPVVLGKCNDDIPNGSGTQSFIFCTFSKSGTVERYGNTGLTSETTVY